MKLIKWLKIKPYLLGVCNGDYDNFDKEKRSQVKKLLKI